MNLRKYFMLFTIWVISIKVGIAKRHVPNLAKLFTTKN